MARPVAGRPRISYGRLSSRHGPRQYWQVSTANQLTMTNAATALATNPSNVSHVMVIDRTVTADMGAVFPARWVISCQAQEAAAELALTCRDVGHLRPSGRGRHDPDRSLEPERLRVHQLPCLVDLGAF